LVVAASAVVFFLVRPPQALSQTTGAPAAGYRRESGTPASTRPAPLREVGFDQNLDQHVPLDTPLVDEAGRTVLLGDYFGTRPVVLLFAYYECPMLCTQVINGLASALGVLTLEPGQDFEIITVSFDPRDTPATATAKKAAYMQRYKRPGAGAAWHFLTGEAASIKRLTEAAGFRYVWDEQTQQFAHPSGVMVLTPDGRLARYLFGIEYSPRDLRLGLVEASAGKVGSPVDALLLYCFHYDPMTGRYGLVIMRAIRIAGAATILALGGFIVLMLRWERTRLRSRHPSRASAGEPGTMHPPSLGPSQPSFGGASPAPGTAPGTQHQARGTP
jgi:protein SCO1/2